MALAAALTTAAVTTALAGGSGDFVGCQDVYLSSGTTCWGPNVHTWIETEGWNVDNDGYANCNGVGNGSGNGSSSWYEYACDTGDKGSGSNNQIYCTSACDGVSGYGFVHDHSANNGDFTGWGEYSS
ncbi:MAG: hypothetical protein ABSG64_12515 [Solirubrobacteraceae bacterium]